MPHFPERENNDEYRDVNSMHITSVWTCFTRLAVVPAESPIQFARSSGGDQSWKLQIEKQKAMRKGKEVHLAHQGQFMCWQGLTNSIWFQDH